MTDAASTSEWRNAFLPIGVRIGERWEPRGGGVLLLERPFVWLVTARAVVTGCADASPSVWVPRSTGHGLLDLGQTMRDFGLEWVHHPAGLSATILPLNPSFSVKAFGEGQCARVRDLQPLQPTATIGALYGTELAAEQAALIAACDGIVSSVNPRSGEILSTAPLLSRNAGAPLLLTSPHSGQVALCGIVLGNLLAAETDPRAMPVRFSRAICVDAALELLRSEAAKAQQQRATAATEAARRGTPPTEAQP
ncbi:MAG: hypothetical protein H6835_07835 [Planctomycetes bacterium]|nr:hypothetical protein [Planctomycetota bacterium]